MTEIPDNAMNLTLTKLYEQKWNKYQTIVKLFSGVVSLANIYLLTTSNNYFNAKVRAMILGKETQGWGGEFNGIGSPSIQELQQLYTLYTYVEKGNGAAFQRFVNWIPTIMDGVEVIANNIVKIGKASTNGHYIDVARASEENLALLKDEITITQPDIVICPTSNSETYNMSLSTQLGKFSQKTIDEHMYLRYYESFPGIPFIICPHPQGKSTHDINRIKGIISEYVHAIAQKY